MGLISEESGKRYTAKQYLEVRKQVQVVFHCISKHFLILLTLFIIFANVSAQGVSDPNAKSVYEFIDLVEVIYGADDLLVNGRIYYQQFPMAEGHPYFINDEWLTGIIFIKGKTFSGYEIKYDLDMDRIVLNTRDRKGAFVDLILNHPMIDSLYIDEHFFINTSQLNIEKDVSNFFEVVYKGDPMMIIYHKKEFLDDYSERHPYGRYRDPAHKLFLFSDEILIEVSSKNAFLNYYKPYKKEIKRYLNQNKIKYKKANFRQLFGLMEFCNQLK